MLWLLLIGLGLVVGYELAAAITNFAPTISEFVWAGNDITPVVGFLAIFGLGVLIGHLFFPRHIYIER